MIKIERKPGGPYKTWYVSTEKKYSSWHDVDPIVNANLLYLSTLYGIKLTSLERYIYKCLENNKYSSQYYPYSLIFVFLLSRSAQKNNNLSKKLHKVLDQIKFESLKPIEKIFFLLSSAYLGRDLKDKHLQEVLDLQNSDGSFPPFPFCYDFARTDGASTYAGSSIITSALILELLLVLSSKNNSTEKDKEANQAGFEKRVQKYFKEYKKASKKESSIDESFDKILQIPIATALSIKKKLNVKEEQTLFNLSLGLFFSWSGYTLFDHILDGQLSSLASAKAQKLVELGWKYLEKLFYFKNFKNEIIEAFLDCDEVYEWEATKPSKIGSFDYIEKRMQPFLVALKFVPLFLGMNKKIAEKIYKIYKTKMIIDQINDDSHDWEVDLKEGRNTYVLSLLMKYSKKRKGRSRIFWEKVMPKMIGICEKEYREAKSTIKRLKPFESYFDEVIDKCFDPIRKAKEEKLKVEKLLQSL